MATIKAPPVHRIAITQLAFLLVLAGLILPWNVTAAYSFFIGGITQIGPQTYFTRYAFRFAGARQAPEILHAIYKGETGKLVLTATMFALAFLFVRPLQAPALFLGYGLMVAVHWLSAVKALNSKTN
jgi:ATP synthase protein I